MGNSSAKPDLQPRVQVQDTIKVEVLRQECFEEKPVSVSAQVKKHHYSTELANTKSEEDVGKDQIWGEKWNQRQLNRSELPAVKPPARKQSIKKTKQAKQNMEAAEQIEEVKFNVKDNTNSCFHSRGKTAPLITVQPGNTIMIDLAKTKKCRVSRML